MQEIYNRFRSELLDNCVPFWLENAVDTRYGGILNCLDTAGTADGGYGASQQLQRLRHSKLFQHRHMVV